MTTKVDLPIRMRNLPVDARGYVIPWFVQWLTPDQKPAAPGAPGALPEFRVMDLQKFARALKERLCWVCGQPLGRWLAFPIGPMCAVTRTTSEPPAHYECALYSVEHCPFLSNPQMVRREEGLPAGAMDNAAGIPLLRNPGVICLWVTRSYERFQDHNKRWLLTVGAPERVEWYREARPATRAEVQTSIDGGLPALLELARRDGPVATELLGRHLAGLDRWLPTS